MNAWIFSSLNYSRIRLPSLKAIILLKGLALIIEGHRIIYHTNPNNKYYNHPTLLSFLFVPNQMVSCVLATYPRLYLSLNPVVIVGDEFSLITLSHNQKPHPSDIL